MLNMEILPDPNAVARHAAACMARLAREAIDQRGRFVAAISGGDTPWPMLRRFAATPLPWSQVHIVQVDERVAPPGSPERNLTQLRASLRGCGARIYPMPVDETPLTAAAARYAALLRELAGTPPVLDAVQLDLDAEGHTASLVPADPALAVDDVEVVVTGRYAGHIRMTLTYPVLNRARRVLWIVTGTAKSGVLGRFFDGHDDTLPANRVERDHALLLTDREAAASYI